MKKSLLIDIVIVLLGIAGILLAAQKAQAWLAVAAATIVR
jgi:hypothetical protein